MSKMPFSLFLSFIAGALLGPALHANLVVSPDSWLSGTIYDFETSTWPMQLLGISSEGKPLLLYLILLNCLYFCILAVTFLFISRTLTRNRASAICVYMVMPVAVNAFFSGFSADYFFSPGFLCGLAFYLLLGLMSYPYAIA